MPFSVVIRNKNEAKNLEEVLNVLHCIYKSDIDEIIVVDNQSTDGSIEVAKKYSCKVITITHFTYGKAINLGIESARNNYVLLLSSHAVPIGISFFENTLKVLSAKKDCAGIRYINSYVNYKRALENHFEVKEPLKYGLMAACCIVVKDVWKTFKFNEELKFSEDKEWSQRVVDSGFKIYEANETFFYFVNRNQKSSMNRFVNETLTQHFLFKTNPPNRLKIIASFFKKIGVENTVNLIKTTINDFKIMKAKFLINAELKKLRENV